MSTKLRIFIQAALLPLPWSLRRRLLNRVFRYEIHPTARVGFSIVAPQKLRMAAGSAVGHLNFIRGMDLVEMEESAGISHLNWIYAVPTGSAHFAGSSRRPELSIGRGAGITRRHFVDCSDRVRLEAYSIVAGYGTQILTHGIDLATGLQSTKPITIGEHTMVGTRCILLAGSAMPAKSALGAGSALRSSHAEPLGIYSGVPAIRVADLNPNSPYFSEASGTDPSHRIR